MGFGFGFNLGPFRAGGSFRGPGATDEEWASLVVSVLWITVPVFIFQVVLEFITDPNFWFVMLVGCLPSVTLLLAHVATLDHVSIGGWWEKRDGSFVLLALPAAGYEILFFVWDSDGFGLRVDRDGFQLRATALYALILFGYLVGEFLWMYFTVRIVGGPPLFDKRLGKLFEIKERRRLLEASQEYVRKYFLTSSSPCSRCGGEVQRNKEKFSIRCNKCNYEHSHLHYPDLVDASFQIELDRLELEQKQRELEEDRQAKALAEHQLGLRANETWRKETRSAMNAVHRQVQKILNPSPGDVVDEAALRHAFEVVERLLPVSDSRLLHNLVTKKIIDTNRRVLRDLATTVKNQIGLDLSSTVHSATETLGEISN